VLNIGNTWSASLQATGALMPFDTAAFDAVGGRDRFGASALGATGTAGQDPAAVPLYSLAYGLYYNKQLFADAGIEEPPATWDATFRPAPRPSGRASRSPATSPGPSSATSNGPTATTSDSAWSTPTTPPSHGR
jgi:hypothetical protein